MFRLTFTLPLFFVSFAALGSTVVGNPNSAATLLTSKSVYVSKVVAYSCDTGSQTQSIETVLHQWDSATLTFDIDEFCDVDLEVRWTQNGPLVTVPVGGFTTFKVTSASTNTVSIDIDSTLQTATLN